MKSCLQSLSCIMILAVIWLLSTNRFPEQYKLYTAYAAIILTFVVLLTYFLSFMFYENLDPTLKSTTTSVIGYQSNPPIVTGQTTMINRPNVATRQVMNPNNVGTIAPSTTHTMYPLVPGSTNTTQLKPAQMPYPIVTQNGNSTIVTTPITPTTVAVNNVPQAYNQQLVTPIAQQTVLNPIVPVTPVIVPTIDNGNKVYNVKMFDFYPGYDYAHIQINQGDTVRWTNIGEVEHNVMADTGEFDSGYVQPGESYTVTFTFPGVYRYHCDIHSGWMEGSVTVS